MVSGAVVTFPPLGIEVPGLLGEGRETGEQEKEENCGEPSVFHSHYDRIIGIPTQ